MSEMLQFLYRIQPTRPDMLRGSHTAEEARAVGEHFAYLQNLMAEGRLILAGRTLNSDDDSFGVVIFRAESEAAAQTTMESDPAVRQGVMSAKLYPYRVALMEGQSN